jgi:hypothetical protein
MYFLDTPKFILLYWATYQVVLHHLYLVCFLDLLKVKLKFDPGYKKKYFYS